mgnify:CR=1 FL=1
MSLPSDEVAEDYKNSLEDLTTNDRFQISNLTVIAKENTEHAMAISRVLENHIRTVGALPVLFFVFSHDSIYFRYKERNNGQQPVEFSD